MAKVKIWKRQDGGVSVTNFDFSKKLSGETDEEFIERKSLKLRSVPNLVGAEEIIADSSELPTDRVNRNKWRVNASKKVFVDHNVVIPKELKLQKLNSAKAKLKAGQPLSDEEAEALTGV